MAAAGFPWEGRPQSFVTWIALQVAEKVKPPSCLGSLGPGRSHVNGSQGRSRQHAQSMRAKGCEGWACVRAWTGYRPGSVSWVGTHIHCLRAWEVAAYDSSRMLGRSALGGSLSPTEAVPVEARSLEGPARPVSRRKGASQTCQIWEIAGLENDGRAHTYG